MVKIFKTSIIIILCVTSFLANAQKKITQGIILYSIEYNLPADKQAMATLLPQEYKMSFKGDFSQFTMDMGMFSTLIIYNNATKETLSLTEVPMQSKKIAVKMNKEQTQKMAEIQGGHNNFEFTTTTEKMQIGGYNCTKYLCKDKQSGSQTAVWATKDVEIPLNTLTSIFKGVNGVPIQFNSDAGGMRAKITIKAIIEENIPDINMVVPKEYEIMQFDDLLKQMGG